MIEHHKENYEAEVAAMEEEATPTMSSSSSEESDDSSSLFSVERSEMTTPTEISLLDFDAELEVIDLDNLSISSDASYMTPP